MRKRSVSLASVLIVLGLLIAVSVTSFHFPEEAIELESQPITQKDFPLQDFELVDLGGDLVKLSDFRGKWVILNFWATWCPPCRQEMPLLVETHEKYSPDLIVLGVNSMETDDEVRAFIERNSISFPIVFDSEGQTGQQYLVHGLPTTLFIDREGVLRIRHVGQLTRPVLDEYLLELGAVE